MTKQLIGQPTSQNPFGTRFGSGGDFNFVSNGNKPAAPNAYSQFTLATSDGNGERLLLTRFAPVPEPSSRILAGTAAMAGLGIWGLRRRYSPRISKSSGRMAVSGHGPVRRLPKFDV